MKRRRHPLFWLIDTVVFAVTWAVWGISDGLFTLAVLAVGIFEGEIYAIENFRIGRFVIRKEKP